MSVSKTYKLPAARRTAIVTTVLAVLGGAAIEGQSREGVGSRNTSTGSVSGGRFAPPSATTGPWVRSDGVLATVRLENSNFCLDRTTECVVYVVNPNSADPALMYAGNAIVVTPVLMKVVMLDESAPIQDACKTADYLPVTWRDVVEVGNTRARVVDVLGRIHDQAADNEGARYRLLWCPVGENAANDWNPKGQSWRFVLLRKSLTSPRSPGAIR
jgi:hypothetical protein